MENKTYNKIIEKEKSPLATNKEISEVVLT